MYDVVEYLQRGNDKEEKCQLLTDAAQEEKVPEPSKEEDIPPDPPPDEVDKQDEWGPKMAETPDPEVIPLGELREVLDVGQLPEHLREHTWEMLQKNAAAFAFDGCLQQYPAETHICTEEGACPIAVPMYGTSPAKRQVIVEQLGAWIRQEVIEPS
ncbi:hypothetical protein PENSPDRAFT_671838 [Peniophora sp. CONT]|nr:hypothetical protein PENSPDRAFT_671838 [Peniophora sp. CONT]